MPNYKSKFNKNWMKIYPWVGEVDDDIHKAYCKLCKCEMKVDVRGIGSLKQHKDTAKHRSITFKIASLKQDSTGMHKMVNSIFNEIFSMFEISIDDILKKKVRTNIDSMR